MSDFINNYGFLMVSMIFGAILGLSVYLPLMAGQLSLATPGFYALGGLYCRHFIHSSLEVHRQSIPNPSVIARNVTGRFNLCCSRDRLRNSRSAITRNLFSDRDHCLCRNLRVLALNLEITGGAVGIFAIPQPFQTQIEYLWIALPLLLLSMLFLYRLERIRVGRALSAIREDELAADAMGINPTYYKVLSFTLGAVLAGLVGAVSAHFLNTWNARQGTFDASIIYLAFVLIGGSRTFVGPVLGGIVLTALPEVLRAIAGTHNNGLAQFLRDGRLIIFGLLIVIGSVFYPQGIITPDLLKRLQPLKRQPLRKDEV
jgi:branched-chain amino acid transport system permease protein